MGKNVEKMTYSEINERIDKLIKTVKSISKKKVSKKNQKVLV
eukprot:SAG11_NODE_67_length_18762_cov_13.942560_2_plen_42_part_00